MAESVNGLDDLEDLTGDGGNGAAPEGDAPTGDGPSVTLDDLLGGAAAGAPGGEPEPAPPPATKPFSDEAVLRFASILASMGVPAKDRKAFAQLYRLLMMAPLQLFDPMGALAEMGVGSSLTVEMLTPPQRVALGLGSLGAGSVLTVVLWRYTGGMDPEELSGLVEAMLSGDEERMAEAQRGMGVADDAEDETHGGFAAAAGSR